MRRNNDKTHTHLHDDNLLKNLHLCVLSTIKNV